MMVILIVAIGILLGWLLSWASDYLPRFSASYEAPAAPVESHLPALFQWLMHPTQKRPRDFWLHLATEVGYGVGLILLWLQFGPTWELISLAIGLAFFLLITLIDLKYRLILNILTYPAIVLVLVNNLLITDHNRLYILVGGGFAFMIFFATAWIKPGDIGGGDIKLATLLGFMFGFPGVLWALIIGAGLGGIVAIVLLMNRRSDAKIYMPYAPFLCLGGVVALLYNPMIM